MAQSILDPLRVWELTLEPSKEEQSAPPWSFDFWSSLLHSLAGNKPVVGHCHGHIQLQPTHPCSDTFPPAPSCGLCPGNFASVPAGGRGSTVRPSVEMNQCFWSTPQGFSAFGLHCRVSDPSIHSLTRVSFATYGVL